MKVTKRNAKRKKSLKTTEGARITTYIVEDGFYPKNCRIERLKDVVTDPFFSVKRLQKKPKCLPNNKMRITSLKVLRSELPDDRLNLENLLANLQLTGPLAGFATCVVARPFKRCPLLVSLFKRGKRPTRGRLRAYWALK